jgi:hypothetical protein
LLEYADHRFWAHGAHSLAASGPIVKNRPYARTG